MPVIGGVLLIAPVLYLLIVAAGSSFRSKRELLPVEMQLDYLALVLLGLLISGCSMVFGSNLSDLLQILIGLPGMVLVLVASVKWQRRYWL